jgi:hypothetical protein
MHRPLIQLGTAHIFNHLIVRPVLCVKSITELLSKRSTARTHAECEGMPECCRLKRLLLLLVEEAAVGTKMKDCRSHDRRRSTVPFL